jgi:hypothetical protein
LHHCSNIHRLAEECQVTRFSELFDHQLRYLGVVVGTPEIPMIDHDHANKLAAKCREMSRQLDAHGSWPFMIEVAETIENLIAERCGADRQIVANELPSMDEPEPIIKMASI